MQRKPCERTGRGCITYQPRREAPEDPDPASTLILDVEPPELEENKFCFLCCPVCGICHGVLCLVTKLCLTLCNPMDCSPPGSSVHGILPGKNTEAGCHALLQGIFPSQQSDPGLPRCRRILYHLSHQESPGNPLKWMRHLPPFTQSYTGPPLPHPGPSIHCFLPSPLSLFLPITGVPLVTPHLWGHKTYLPPSYPGPPTSRGYLLHLPLDTLSPTSLGSHHP